MLVSSMVFWDRMNKVRKITVEVPPELLDRAQRASGGGITETVRTGLKLVAASQAYARLRERGERFASRARWLNLRPTDDRG